MPSGVAGAIRALRQTPNTKQRSRRIISQRTVPGFGRNTPGTEAVSFAPSKSIAKSTRLSRPR